MELEQGLTITIPQEYVRKVNVRAGSSATKSGPCREKGVSLSWTGLN